MGNAPTTGANSLGEHDPGAFAGVLARVSNGRGRERKIVQRQKFFLTAERSIYMLASGLFGVVAGLARRNGAIVPAAIVAASLSCVPVGAGPWDASRIVASAQDSDPAGVSLRGAPCGTDALSQSTNPNLVSGGSVWCGDLVMSDDTSLARAFVAPYDLVIDCVTLGIRSNTGGQWPVDVRILQGDVTSAYDGLIVRDEVSTSIASGTTNQLVTVPTSPVLLAAGTPFVVELHTASRLPASGGDGGLIQLGFNGAGQSAPSYFRSLSCSEPDFVDLASLGFGGRHLVMTVGVHEASPGPVLAGGFEYTPVGGAALARAGDVLLAAGDPAGGAWGVSVGIGTSSMGVESVGVQWEIEAGAGVRTRFHSAATTDQITFMGMDDASVVLQTQFAPPISPTFDVRVYEGGQYVGSMPNQTSGSVTITPDSRIKILGLHIWCKSKTITRPDGTIEKEWDYGAKFEGGIELRAGGGEVLHGDAFEMRLRSVPPGGLPPPIDIEILALNLASMELPAVQSPTLVGIGTAPSEPIVVGQNQLHTDGVFVGALPSSGPILLQGGDVDGDGSPELQIFNIGSSGQDGVMVRLGGVETANIGVEPINPSVPGSCLSFRSIQLGGLDGGTVLLDPDPMLPDWFALAPNFNGIGAGTYRLAIYDHGTLVYTDPGNTGQALASRWWPWKLGKLGGRTPCLQACYPLGTEFIISGSGQVVIGDDVRMLAEGAPPFELIDSFEIKAFNMNGLVLSNPSVELPPPPCPADMNGDGTLDFFDVLNWLNQFSAHQPGGDFNHDGVFDFFDALSFLSAFSAGCA